MRRNIRLISTVVGSAAVAAILLTGCGQKVGGGSASSGSNDDTVTYWSSWSEGEPQQKIFASAIADFEKATGTTVDVRWLGRDYVSIVNNANAVGDGPDLFDDATDHIAAFRAKGAVGDMSTVLDEEIPGEGKTVASVIPESVIIGSSDAEGLGQIPYSVISTAMWFDAVAHPELKTSPPATFDDFLTILKDAQRGGDAPIAQDGTINFYNAYWFYWLQMRHGGPGSLAALGADAAAWDEPSVLAAAQDVERLVALNPFQPSYMGTKYPAAQNEWAQGQHMFALNGSWLASETAPTAKEGFAPQTFSFPAVDGGYNSVEVGALGWTVNAQAKNPQGAAKFIAFTMQKTYMERIASEALNISARSDVAAPAPLTALQESVIAATSINKTYDEAPALHPAWWSDVFLPLDDKLLSGELTAEQFVAEGKKQTQAALDAQ